MRNKNQSSAAPSMTSGLRSNEPSTAGGRELRLKARPPARFNSLRSERTVNQKQEPLGNTLLAQRYTLSGNSYFWRATRIHSPSTSPVSVVASAANTISEEFISSRASYSTLLVCGGEEFGMTWYTRAF